MSAKACVNDKLLRLFFEDAVLRDKVIIAYNPGAALTGFLRLNPDGLDGMYDVLISKFLNVKGGRFTDDDEERLKGALAGINAKSPYLIYYTDILSGVLLSVLSGKPFDMTNVFKWLPKTNELYDLYRRRSDEDSENADRILGTCYPARYLESCSKQQKAVMLRRVNNILCIKEAIMLDLVKKRVMLAEELELLYGEKSIPVDTRKLLMLDAERSRQGEKTYYINSEFTVTQELLTGEGARIPDETSLNEEYLKQNEVGLYELYDVAWLDDLIRLEFLKTLEKKVLIRKCQNCGRLFAPSGRIDTIYCDAAYGDTGKSCAEIGAVNKFKEKTASNPVHKAFNKAYKRNNSRVRNNKMTKQEFKQWLSIARDKRSACIEGEIEIGEFKKWLGNK